MVKGPGPFEQNRSPSMEVSHLASSNQTVSEKMFESVEN